LDKRLIFTAQKPHTVVDTRETMENLINRGHLSPDGQVFPMDFVRSAQWFRLGQEHIQNYDHSSLKHWGAFLKELFEENRDNTTRVFNGAKSFFAWIDTKGPKLLASPRTSPKFNATWTTHALMRLPTAAELRQAIITSYDPATNDHYDDVFDAIEKNTYVPKNKIVFMQMIKEFDRARSTFPKGIDANLFLPSLHKEYLDCADNIVDHRFLRDVPEAHGIVFNHRTQDSDGRVITGIVSNHEMNRAAAEAFNMNKGFLSELDQMFVTANTNFKRRLNEINDALKNVDHVDAYRALVGRKLEREARVR